MASRKYVAKPAIRQAVSKKTPILLPIFARNHWALVIIEHARIALRDLTPSSVVLYDSLPSVGIRTDASAQVAGFFRNYLPSTPTHLHNPMLVFNLQQTNGIDCGVFVFAFGIHAIAKRPFWVTLDARLWRHIMAALAFMDVITWDELLPKKSQPPPLPSLTPPRPESPDSRTGTGASILEAATRMAIAWHREIKC
ncbi:hypothetical protein LY78DRAFT_581247 [Colletotrichum sublineola]|nr:hypothetical protein LY78DRAFT_581247 [Colletotrichum sublineola]